MDMNKAILKALLELGGGPAKSKEIAERIGVPTSKVSCRLSPLAKKGLLEKTPQGYKLTPEGEREAKA